MFKAQRFLYLIFVIACSRNFKENQMENFEDFKEEIQDKSEQTLNFEAEEIGEKMPDGNKKRKNVIINNKIVVEEEINYAGINGTLGAHCYNLFGCGYCFGKPTNCKVLTCNSILYTIAMVIIILIAYNSNDSIRELQTLSANSYTNGKINELARRIDESALYGSGSEFSNHKLAGAYVLKKLCKSEYPNCKQCGFLTPPQINLTEDIIYIQEQEIGLKCTKCNRYYGFEEGVCVPCVVEKCAFCNGDPNKCTNCEEGYHYDLKNNTCKKSA